MQNDYSCICLWGGWAGWESSSKSFEGWYLPRLCSSVCWFFQKACRKTRPSKKVCVLRGGGGGSRGPDAINDDEGGWLFLLKTPIVLLFCFFGRFVDVYRIELVVLAYDLPII